MIPDEAVGHVMSALRGHLELTTAEAEAIAKSVLEVAAPIILSHEADRARLERIESPWGNR